MLDIVKQTMDFYTKYLKAPSINDIKIDDTSLMENKWSVFVTIYKKWEIRWWAGNIKELKSSLVLEIIENTIEAISQDSRFSPVKLDEVKDIKIRVDLITSRKILKESEVLSIDPVKNGVLVIKKDYSSTALILPNINPLLLTWEDLIPVLEEKLQLKKLKEKDFIMYSIETKTVNNF